MAKNKTSSASHNHNLGDYVPLEQQNIINKEINQEMRNSFLDYSMSVITSRALPDVREACSQKNSLHNVRKAFVSECGIP